MNIYRHDTVYIYIGTFFWCGLCNIRYHPSMQVGNLCVNGCVAGTVAVQLVQQLFQQQNIATALSDHLARSNLYVRMKMVQRLRRKPRLRRRRSVPESVRSATPKLHKFITFRSLMQNFIQNDAWWSECMFMHQGRLPVKSHSHGRCPCTHHVTGMSHGHGHDPIGSVQDLPSEHRANN